MQTEKQITARLGAPFLPEEHELHERFNLIYLKKKPISDRLTRVLGNSGWSFNLIGEPLIRIVEENDSPTKQTQIEMVTQQARITLRLPVFDNDGIYVGTQETFYENVGGDVLLALGKSHAERLMNTIKGATTDSFKRAASSAGVGLYLSNIPKGLEFAELGTWLITQGYAPSIAAAKGRFFTETGFKKGMVNEEAEAKSRIDWKNANGYTDYDLQTMCGFMIEQYLEFVK